MGMLLEIRTPWTGLYLPMSFAWHLGLVGLKPFLPTLATKDRNLELSDPISLSFLQCSVYQHRYFCLWLMAYGFVSELGSIASAH